MAVYGYVRVSTARQSNNGQSLDVQKRAIEGYALQHGLEIAQTFVERGVSGSKPLEDRPQGKALLDVLRPGDGTVCPKMDRMFRSALDALLMCEKFEKNKLELHLLDMGGCVVGNERSASADLFFTVMVAFAQFERGRLAERVREAKAKLKSQGRFLGGSVPFGYRVENKLLVEVPEEQKAIRSMKRLRKQEKSLRVIAEKVSEKLGRKVAFRTVKSVLDN